MTVHKAIRRGRAMQEPQWLSRSDAGTHNMRFACESQMQSNHTSKQSSSFDCTNERQTPDVIRTPRYMRLKMGSLRQSVASSAHQMIAPASATPTLCTRSPITCSTAPRMF